MPKQETVVLGGNTYVLQEYELPSALEIMDRTIVFTPASGEKRVIVGTEMLLTVVFSLVSWSIEEKGKPVKISEATVRNHLPKAHLVPLYVKAAKLNEVEDGEKNASSDQSAST